MATAVKDKPARQAKRDEAPGPNGDAEAAVGGSVVIEAGTLAGAMKHAASIVAAANTIPILACARLVAGEAGLELTTSDLDTEFRQVLPVTQPGALATCIDAKRLSALASAVDAKAAIRLTQDAEGHRLTVQSGRSRWVLPTLPVADFPTMPFDGDPGVATIDLPGTDLARAIARTAPFASTEPTRYYLNGIFLHALDGKAAFATSNGHGLMQLPLDRAWPDGAASVILPNKFVRTLERVAGDASASVHLAWDERKLRAAIGELWLTGKVVQGQFPDYQRVIPSPGDNPVTVDPEVLAAAVRRVALIASEKTKAVKLERGADRVTVSLVSVEAGTASEEVAACGAEAAETGVNSQYLAAMLAAIGGDSVDIHQADPGAPLRFTRKVSDGAVGVIMPMRV